MIMPSSHLVGWKIPENENAREIHENQKLNGLKFYLEKRRLDLQFPSSPSEKSAATSRDTGVGEVQWSHRGGECTA